MLINGAEAPLTCKTPVFARPVQPEPAFRADLATEPRYLSAGKLQIVLVEFSPQLRGDVDIEEFANLGQPSTLLGIEFEVHSGPYLSLERRLVGLQLGFSARQVDVRPFLKSYQPPLRRIFQRTNPR